MCAWDCNNPPKDVVDDTEECCKSPQLIPNDLETECSNKFESEPREFQKQCLVSTCIMDKMNLTMNGNFMRESAMDHIKRTVTNDPIWEQTMENVTKGCFEYAVTHIDQFKELNKNPKLNMDISDVTKCNPLYVVFIACMDADLLTECPDHSFIQNQKCQDWRQYSKDCGDDNLYLTV
uniref:CSON014966 protein n=1 Tax=Culicoides sonorensis TaxID=179676 RepID=A0A336MEX2_CULSO